MGEAADGEVSALTHNSEAKSTALSVLCRSVLAAMSEGLVIHDRDGRIIDANAVASKILAARGGKRDETGPATERWGLVRPDGSPLPMDEVPSEITRRTGKPCLNHQVGARLPDGSMAWLSVSTAVIPDDDGVIELNGQRPRVVVTFTNVTRERAMAEGLRRAVRHEALGEISAGLIHNFNNLLAVILPNLEMARSQELPPEEVRQAVDDALSATRSAADLVQQLFAFSRAPAEERANVRSVEITSLTRDAVRLCRRTFSSAITITEEVSARGLYVMGQPASLQQVVMNLCLNARDALAGVQQPRLAVALDVVTGASGRHEARWVVEDNGSGMTSETVARLGEPFFTTKPVGRGTGLGLTSVFGIVRDAGGTIRCDSALGRGTRFEVRLPLWEEAQAATPVLVAAREPLATGEVLIVDDQELVRAVWRRQLRDAGFVAHEAASGIEALAYLESTERLPDVVLLDLSMPVMSGEQVLALITVRWPALPVIVASGHRAVDQDLARAFAVLPKPVTGDALAAVVGAAVASRRGTDGSGGA